MILRIDDVSPNTNLVQLQAILNEIVVLPKIDGVIIGVNLLSRRNADGSVYPSPPFKSQALPFFYSVDTVLNPLVLSSLGNIDIASHGLIHADHSKMQRQTQELSIITSCNVLNTNTFIPPFNYYNDDTESICRINNIDLIKPDNYKSLDYEVLVNNNFDVNQTHYYMHPWRWTLGKFKDRVSGPLNRLFQANT